MLSQFLKKLVALHEINENKFQSIGNLKRRLPFAVKVL